MKNILTKLPTFIYSLIVLSCILIGILSYILNHLDPQNTTSKLFFALILVFISMMTIPTIKTLFLILEEEYPEDLRIKFRIFFWENILFSMFLGVLILLKTFGFFTFMTFISFLLIFIGVNYSYKKLRKPRRIKRI